MLAITNIIRNVPKAKTSHHRFYKDTLPGDCHVAMLLAMT